MTKNKSEISIGIPTYNRPESVEFQARKLSSVEYNNLNIFFIDNASKIPVKKIIDKAVPNNNFKIIRNKVNIGGNANNLRCIENCNTKWLLILGDDDELTKDATQILEETIRIYNDATYINFSRNLYKYRNTVVSRGIRELIENIEHWPSFIFMSNSLVNIEKTRAFLDVGYNMLSSWAPAPSIVLLTIGDNDKVIFSNKELICSSAFEKPTWDPVIVANGAHQLTYSIKNAIDRRKLRKIINSKPSLIFLLKWMIDNKKFNEDSPYFLSVLKNRFTLRPLVSLGVLIIYFILKSSENLQRVYTFILNKYFTQNEK